MIEPIVYQRTARVLPGERTSYNTPCQPGDRSTVRQESFRHDYPNTEFCDIPKFFTNFIALIINLFQYYLAYKTHVYTPLHRNFHGFVFGSYPFQVLSLKDSQQEGYTRLLYVQSHVRSHNAIYDHSLMRYCPYRPTY